MLSYELPYKTTNPQIQSVSDRHAEFDDATKTVKDETKTTNISAHQLPFTSVGVCRAVYFL